MATYLDVATAKSGGFEGTVAWMYLDTVGVVTTAEGRALFKVQDATGLEFWMGGPRRATDIEVAADWTRVKAMQPGRPAAFYRTASSPQLKPDMMARMLYTAMCTLDAKLRMRLDGYPAAPDVAKVALLDMAYNLGVDGLLKFTHLCAAVKAADWKAAATQCERNGPGPGRNQWTKQQFVNAAAGVNP